MTEKGFTAKYSNFLIILFYILTNYRRSAYFNQFKRWGDAPKKKSDLLKDSNLLSLVTRLYNDNMTHSEILRALQKFEGFPHIKDWQLKVIRKKANLVYRHRSGIPTTELEKAVALIKTDLNSSLITQWGYRSVANRLRTVHQMQISQHAVNIILRILDPDAVKTRAFYNPARRQRYIVKGPNRIWSIDGHDKLSAYGFQIYGIIDAYSRRILGMFVGLSNQTQIAVLKYYLHTIKKYGIPKSIRADKGIETLLVAATQFQFRRTQKPNIPLEKTWAYGTSTKNQRIERWWRTLVDQQTDQWIDYFDQLKGKGLFDSSKYDRIALQYLFMDTLRSHIASFVQMYNSHAIRLQKSRELYLPSGKPNVMYNYPAEGHRNYSTIPDPSLLLLLENQLSWFDDTAYLVQATKALCDDIISKSGIPYDRSDTKILPGLHEVHTQLYVILRNELYKHEVNGGLVEELQPPRGSLLTIDSMVEKFQNEEVLNSVGEDLVPRNLLGEVEVNFSDQEGGNEAENETADSFQFGDDGVFFEV